MSSKEKFKTIGQTQIIQKRSESNNKPNNTKNYSVQKVVIQKSYKTTYNTNGTINNQRNLNQNKTSQYQIKSENPVIKNQLRNKDTYQSKGVKIYEYTSSNSNSMNSLNLKHHQNQVNNLIHNHRFYTSVTSKTENVSKSSQIGSRTRTERSERIQSLSPAIKNKYIIETKKVELFAKPTYSSVSNSSKETNVSLSKAQIKKLMINMWREETYCSNVESLCCIVDKQATQRSTLSVGIYEKEIEQKNILIKDYEAQILKLKSLLNVKEQEMKQLVKNLKESEVNIRNKKIYELDSRTINNAKENLDKDAHSLEIISFKKGWKDTIIPSPVNEIFIQNIMNSNNYEEMIKMKMTEEEILKRKKLEKISNFEIQEMGLLSIISRKPKIKPVFQHLESMMIFSKEKLDPLKFQKMEEMNVVSHEIKAKNKIQQLDAMEILQLKKNKKLSLQEQKLNGLEIVRDYDMLLVKPKWDSLKVQGTGLNLLSMKRNVELENQEMDEFEIHGKKPEKIHVLIPLAENKIQKLNSFQINRKIKIGVEKTIKDAKLEINEKQKEEKINWSEIIMPIKTTKLFIKRNYAKMENKLVINWNELMKPIKSTKLVIKGKMIKEEPKKDNILKIEKKDEFNFLNTFPEKKSIEFCTENFNINLLASQKELKKSLKEPKEEIDIIEKKDKKVILIENKIDSINIFGLKKKNILIPSSTQSLFLISEEKDTNIDWNDHNKVMKTRELNIHKKIKEKNDICKQVVNIEIASKREIILKPMEAHKLIIKGIEKKLTKKPSFKQIKENILFIRSMKKKVDIVKKPEIIFEQIKENKLFIKGKKKSFVEKQILKVVNWNELVKIQKNPNINLTQKAPKIDFKIQNLNTFNVKGIKQLQEQITEKNIIINNWAESLKAQKNTKFAIKGKKFPVKLLIIKGDKFMIKKEPEEEIIFNDDYNHLSKKKIENGKKKSEKEKEEKIMVIKEKEITPIIQREIKAQVIRVKEESSETSSQSDIDVLAGIRKKGLNIISYDKDNKNSGYYKKIINGEVIFTPKNNLGVNLGGAKYKKEIIVKKKIVLNKKENSKVSGLEIRGNNGEIYYEGIGGISGVIGEGNYKIMNGGISGLNEQKKLTSLYQSTNNIRKNNKISKVPNDSKKKNIKKKFVVKSNIKVENLNEGNFSQNFDNNTQILTGDIVNERNKKIIFKSNLTSENLKHSSSSYGLTQNKGNYISMNKEETYVYEHKDNGNFNK